jgi:purine-binding chemotaxis protein CheW
MRRYLAGPEHRIERSANVAQQKSAAVADAVESKTSKFLTFVLAGEEYGLEILKVREIIGMMDITSVPRTPDFVSGVINLRGKVIPTIDLRLKFGMPGAERTEETCIIVVDVGGVEMGIIVDKVSEVMDIAVQDIEEAPSFGVEVNTDFILGMGKTESRVTILLDIGKVLTNEDIVPLHKIVSGEGGEEK